MKDGSRAYQHILSLPTREERRAALGRVPEEFRDAIEFTVKMEFMRIRREAQNAESIGASLPHTKTGDWGGRVKRR